MLFGPDEIDRIDVDLEGAECLLTDVSELASENRWLLRHLHKLFVGVVHSTSWSAFGKIVEDGVIRPCARDDNVQPRFGDTSLRSYGQRTGSVCLFDFQAARFEDVVRSRGTWLGVLTGSAARQRSRVVVHLQMLVKHDGVDLVGSEEALCPSCEAPLWGCHSSECVHADRGVALPFVECWHEGPISMRLVERVHIVIEGRHWHDVDVNGAMRLAQEFPREEDLIHRLTGPSRRPEIPNPQVKDVADQFFDAHRKLNEVQGGTLMPMLHCGMIAIELYLKSLRADDDDVAEGEGWVKRHAKPTSGHRPTHLFNRLYPDIQACLESEFQCIAPGVDLRETLRNVEFAFTASRYPYESSREFAGEAMGEIDLLASFLSEFVLRLQEDVDGG